MSDLNDALPAGSAWILTAATAINDNGDIVGTGLLNGQQHGFLLTSGQTPPPPSDNQPPVAVASVDSTTGRAPLTVNFDGSGSYDPEGPIAAWAWDFGDGSETDTTPHPAHVHVDPGTCIAVLTVMDAQGMTASAQLDIRVRKAQGNGR